MGAADQVPSLGHGFTFLSIYSGAEAGSHADLGQRRA